MSIWLELWMVYSNNPSRHLFAGEWKKASLSVEWAKILGSYNASRCSPHQHWRRMWEATFTKMSTPSRSRSSAMGDEGYFGWRESMERRQEESEWQVQALLQETRRLRKENDVLRIQVSSSGPPRDQRLRGQGTNSRHNQEATYPGNVEPFPDMCGVRLNKGPFTHLSRTTRRKLGLHSCLIKETMQQETPVIWRNACKVGTTGAL